MKQKLRVLYVGAFPSSERPDEGIFLHRSIQALSDHVQPLVLHPRAWMPRRPLVLKREWGGIPVITATALQFPGASHVLRNGWLLRALLWPVVRRITEHVDLIHSADFFPTGAVAGFWARWTDKPHVSHATGSDVNEFLQSRVVRGHRWVQSMSSQVDAVVCNSTRLSAEVNRMVPGIPLQAVIHRGVNLETFCPSGAVVRPDIPTEHLQFLYVGGFYRSSKCIKGSGVLMKAWRQVEKACPHCHLTVGGPNLDAELVEEWRQSLAHPNRVHVIGRIAPAEVPARFRGADAVIIPSLQEGLPNVALEAQACGCPVLGSDVGGIPEAVLHGITGHLVPPGDPKSLAEAIIQYGLDPGKLRQMGQAGRSHVEKRFSWSRFRDEMVTVYQAALAAHGKRWEP